MPSNLFSTRNFAAWAALTMGATAVDAKLASDARTALGAAADAPNAQAMLASLDLYRRRMGSTDFTDELRTADYVQPYAGRGPLPKNWNLVSDISEVAQVRRDLTVALAQGPVSDDKLGELKGRLKACGTFQTVCGPAALYNRLSE